MLLVITTEHWIPSIILVSSQNPRNTSFLRSISNVKEMTETRHTRLTSVPVSQCSINAANCHTYAQLPWILMCTSVFYVFYFTVTMLKKLMIPLCVNRKLKKASLVINGKGVTAETG